MKEWMGLTIATVAMFTFFSDDLRLPPLHIHAFSRESEFVAFGSVPIKNGSEKKDDINNGSMNKPLTLDLLSPHYIEQSYQMRENFMIEWWVREGSQSALLAVDINKNINDSSCSSSWSQWMLNASWPLSGMSSTNDSVFTGSSSSFSRPSLEETWSC
ncbi:hypothetical protein Hanom_Chr16g01435011 [Helianthus anomalus]